jgi:hypothetical protein
MLRVSDCIADCIWLSVPQTTERQRIGNQIDAAMIFARADFVNVLNLSHFPGPLQLGGEEMGSRLGEEMGGNWVASKHLTLSNTSSISRMLNVEI